MHHFLSIDLGAESGRLILGSIDDGGLQLKEIHRFANGMLRLRNKFYWNIGNLYKEIIRGIEICVARERVQPESIGIDTWGVDFGLLTKDGTLLGLPYAYRDPRTTHAIEEFTASFPAKKIYSLTGTLFAPYNTLFQLYAAKKYHPELIDSAAHLLFIPDLLTYFLTGEKKTEFSFATTSQLFNPLKNCWEEELFDALSIPSSIMAPVVEPGQVIGYLEDEICRSTGIQKIPVVAVATHDTNSAIAAVPAQGDRWAFISSGTWSLMGMEMKAPLLTEEAFSRNFTNEGGPGHSYSLLKNHMGLWLLQQCKKSWASEGYTYPGLESMAGAAVPFSALIDVDDLAFLNPPDMTRAIDGYCGRTRQRAPVSHGAMARIILESLALKYGETADQLSETGDRPIDEVYITGGGMKNELLCQFTANATGRVVKTGLAEGTAAGNILVQAMGMALVSSPEEIRKLVADSCCIKVYEPADTSLWKEARDRYRQFCLSSQKESTPL